MKVNRAVFDALVRATGHPVSGEGPGGIGVESFVFIPFPTVSPLDDVVKDIEKLSGYEGVSVERGEE